MSPGAAFPPIHTDIRLLRARKHRTTNRKISWAFHSSATSFVEAGVVRRWLFDRIYQRTLVYNQCWEDPMVDHAALEITPTDRIVMITSAGCNALDYLLK